MADTAPLAFAPHPAPTVPLADGRLFPIRRVFCVGRNYADHVVEMGGDVRRNPPIFFTKPADAVRCNPGTLPWPMATDNLHHEVEWVVALFGGGRRVPPDVAGSLVGASGVGLDLTRRDLQAKAKEGGEPWDAAKAFDDSAPLSTLHAGSLSDIPADAELSLSINGKVRQSATVDHMIHPVAQLLSELSELFELAAGDLVFTGTPAGVGPLARGDQVVATLSGVAELAFCMADE